MQFLSTACLSLDRSTIGGKGERLCALLRLGLPVKPGVVLDVDEIDQIRAVGTVEDDLLRAITAALTVEPHGVAVRSSATDEDGERSWAGQFATHLFVSRSGLEEAILSCARALDSTIVASYAATHSLPMPRLALVIQEMVPAAVAGVLFTRDPTSRLEEMVIEAVDGVGESLVSGSREPRRYYLCRETGEVLRENGAASPVLAPEVLRELFTVGRQLEVHFGCPQDAEWAIDSEGRLFLTQCRDITTQVVDLEPIRARVIRETEAMLAAERDRLAELGITYTWDVLSDTNVGELLTRHPCQMTYGMFTYIFAHGEGGIRSGRNAMGYNLGDEMSQGFVVLVGGQPRASIVHDAMTFRVSGVSPEIYSRALAHYLALIAEDPRRANYPEIGLYQQWPTECWITEVFGADATDAIAESYATFHSGFGVFESGLDRECRLEWLPAWRAKMGSFTDRVDAGEVSPALFRELVEALRTDACRQFVLVARVGFFAFDRLRRRLCSLYGKDGDAHLNVLTAGVPPELNPNLRFGMALQSWKAGDLAIGELLAEFGHLGIHEMDISLPRYREEPERLSRLAAEIRGNPASELAASAVAAEDLRGRLLGSSPGIDDPVLAHDIDVVRRFLPLREVIKFEFLRAYDLIRRLLMGLESRLAWPKDLIFHLDPLDLVQDGIDWEELRRTADLRRCRWDENRQIYIPPILMGDDLEAIGRPPSLDGANALSGVGVTNFIAEGEAVVVRSLDDADALGRLRPGSILVTETTDPAWTPVLAVIGRQGGIVTEVGGILAHGAVYAREMGIAAVLNVPAVTQILKTGMRIRVHGPLGRIEILSEP